MRKSIAIWKQIGWTPLQTIEELKIKNPKYQNIKISYAGRLDPMAEGVLLLLIGEENKKRKDYENFPKKYESEIVLGISSDSFDVLGIIDSIRLSSDFSEKKIKDCLKTFEGIQKQKYPPYSSKPANGKPLYWWAKNNKLPEISIPEKEIEIFSINLLSISKITGLKLYETAKEKIEKVRGDFRQEEILKSWDKFLRKYKNENFQVIKIEISTSSGTYIRRLAYDIGERLNSKALAVSITRVSVGKYSKSDCIEIV